MLFQLSMKASLAGDKVPTSGLEASRFEIQFHRRSTGYVHLVISKSPIMNQTSSSWYGAEVWRLRLRVRCRPRHLIAVQNDESLPK
ncbi:hypothetical protein AVEN_159847-1 [Araneus ventricosus]|uniref:Uncharacterized protein n=1 Tax=Araneus ventricosus TaxID=182803 RepID=A0A4Y2HFN7_ARAVE|nr:hypothetical protein AVEN_159847-1 [Araneus ventricosus]